MSASFEAYKAEEEAFRVRMCDALEAAKTVILAAKKATRGHPLHIGYIVPGWPDFVLGRLAEAYDAITRGMASIEFHAGTTDPGSTPGTASSLDGASHGR